MRPMETFIAQILAEIDTSVGQISAESLTQAGAVLESAPRIFAAGAGRSGLCIRALGMRLMQLGKTVYVVGETITPSIQTGDLLVLGSGSGQTPTLLVIAQKARQAGAEILLFTTDPNSPLAELADHLVLIPAPSLNLSAQTSAVPSIQPMGTLFEQSLLILCDSLILSSLAGASPAQMRERHANLE